MMFAALFVVGATYSAAMVIWGTLLQRRVPDGLRGRVSSLDFFVSLADAGLDGDSRPGRGRIRARRRLPGRRVRTCSWRPRRSWSRGSIATNSRIRSITRSRTILQRETLCKRSVCTVTSSLVPARDLDGPPQGRVRTLRA